MLLLDHFAKLLDIPVTDDRYEIIQHEARNKFIGTYLFINGSLCYLEDIGADTLQVYRMGQDGSASMGEQDIDSLDVFLPETGVYCFRGTYFFLHKRTKKQWKKSFNWNYYTASMPIPNHAAYSLVGKKPVTIYDGGDGSVYYIDIRIGRVINGVYKCTDPIFQSEFDEFVKGVRNGT